MSDDIVIRHVKTEVMLTFADGEAGNTVTFLDKDGDLLKLDKEGFHYKGETIDDLGVAYDLFLKFMRGWRG